MSQFKIEINNRQSLVEIDEPRIQQAICAVLTGEKITSAEFNVAIVDNAEIHQLNREFLQHDYETDVISFLLAETGEPVEGELMVSAEMAANCAAEYGWSTIDELLLYVIHGTLHIVGYDDLQDDLRAEMRTRETHYLEQLGIDVSHRKAAAGGAE
ncbi:MAG: rRNA maturation RNase YbeY [Planctomycetota bacterium]